MSARIQTFKKHLIKIWSAASNGLVSQTSKLWIYHNILYRSLWWLVRCQNGFWENLFVAEENYALNLHDMWNKWWIAKDGPIKGSDVSQHQSYILVGHVISQSWSSQSHIRDMSSILYYTYIQYGSDYHQDKTHPKALLTTPQQYKCGKTVTIPTHILTVYRYFRGVSCDKNYHVFNYEECYCSINK